MPVIDLRSRKITSDSGALLALSTIYDNYGCIIRAFTIAQPTKHVCTCGMKGLPPEDRTKLDRAY